jgi:predicted RNase H-like nuclease
MTNDSEHVWLAGVDGCPSGWIAAFVHPAADAVELAIFSCFADVLAAKQRPVIVAIDIPVGLPKIAGKGGRAAENAVRSLLGERQSSVFSVPARASIYACDYSEACHIALGHSDPPRKISKQLFNIAPKIREVDEMLRTDISLAARLYEVHPELAFWRLNGERPLNEPKKIKSRCHEPGLTQRRRLLIEAGFHVNIVNTIPPKGAGADDLLDAFACAAIARRLHTGIARPFPNPPPCDDYGLPMAIWA